MPPRLRHIPLLALLVCSALALTPGPVAGVTRDLEGQQAAASKLRESVKAESDRIAETRAGVAQAEEELAGLTARADRRQAKLDKAQNKLIELRIQLTRLEEKEAKSEDTLGKNLVASYKSGPPNLVSVVLDSHGFADMLERVEFYERVSERNAAVVDNTRDAHDAVANQSDAVEKQRARYSQLAQAAIQDRDRAAVLRSALLQRQADQLAQRRGMAQRLETVQGRIASIERQQARAAQGAVAASSATAEAPTVSTKNLGSKGTDGVVAKVIAGANEIATTPYQYGGGHGGSSGGYDCSGSVSYALAAGGLISTPLDSSGFMSWGAAGEGQRITVYANPGHAYMVVDGRRFDTSALSGGGTRWTSESRSSAGYVARHPPGF
jgi:septal ring factor EnvC (AmiA/AmiB activator)